MCFFRRKKKKEGAKPQSKITTQNIAGKKEELDYLLRQQEAQMVRIQGEIDAKKKEYVACADSGKREMIKAAGDVAIKKRDAILANWKRVLVQIMINGDMDIHAATKDMTRILQGVGFSTEEVKSFTDEVVRDVQKHDAEADKQMDILGFAGSELNANLNYQNNSSAFEQEVHADGVLADAAKFGNAGADAVSSAFLDEIAGDKNKEIK